MNLAQFNWKIKNVLCWWITDTSMNIFILNVHTVISEISTKAFFVAKNFLWIKKCIESWDRIRLVLSDYIAKAAMEISKLSFNAFVSNTGQRLQMLAVVLNWSWHICTFLYQKYLEKVSSIKTDASEFFNTKFGKFVYSLKEIGSSCYSYTYVYKYIYSYICIKMCISIYHMFKIRVMLFFRSKALYYLTDFSKI